MHDPIDARRADLWQSMVMLDSARLASGACIGAAATWFGHLRDARRERRPRLGSWPSRCCGGYAAGGRVRGVVRAAADREAGALRGTAPGQAGQSGVAADGRLMGLALQEPLFGIQDPVGLIGCRTPACPGQARVPRIPVSALCPAARLMLLRHEGVLESHLVVKAYGAFVIVKNPQPELVDLRMSPPLLLKEEFHEPLSHPASPVLGFYPGGLDEARSVLVDIRVFLRIRVPGDGYADDFRTLFDYCPSCRSNFMLPMIGRLLPEFFRRHAEGRGRCANAFAYGTVQDSGVTLEGRLPRRKGTLRPLGMVRQAFRSLRRPTSALCKANGQDTTYSTTVIGIAGSDESYEAVTLGPAAFYHGRGEGGRFRDELLFTGHDGGRPDPYEPQPCVRGDGVGLLVGPASCPGLLVGALGPPPAAPGRQEAGRLQVGDQYAGAHSEQQ